MTGPRAIRTIAILGAGIVGSTAARAFSRALPDVALTLIDTPANPAALADRLPASLPAVNPFHARISLSEAELVKEGIATHRLGTRFDKWSADGTSWIHAYGDHGLFASGIAFHQLWLRARQRNVALPFDHYSAAASLLRADKFVHPQPGPGSPLSTFDYALRFDAGRYRDVLRQDSSAELLSGRLEGVERRADGGVAAVTLTGGRVVAADLYLDCSGPDAPLLSALDASFETWDAWLPCDRLLLRSAPKAGVILSDLTSAVDIGWRWRDYEFEALAYSAVVTDEGVARELFGAGQVEPIRLRVGRRPRPWIANVVAIGDAAVAVDPLGAVNLHLAQSAITRVLDLLPGRDCPEIETREYNRRSEQQAVRVRDFQALHYLRRGTHGGPFWRALRDRDLPDSLAHTLDQFQARGRLPFFEEDAFDRDSWLAVLFGLGVLPSAYQPTTERVDTARSDAAMAALAERLAVLPAQLPCYGDYLAQSREQRS